MHAIKFRFQSTIYSNEEILKAIRSIKVNNIIYTDNSRVLNELRLLREQKDEHQLDCYSKIKEAQDIIQNLIKESKMKVNLVKTMVDTLVINTITRTFDELITLKNSGIALVKFTSGEVLERGIIELKSNVVVENFNNGRKESIIYSLFSQK